jgi:hypothetical protein
VAEYLEDVRCRGCMGIVGVSTNKRSMYHDVMCAWEELPATRRDDRDAVIENLFEAGICDKPTLAAMNGISRQAIDQILKRVHMRQ